MNHSHDVIRKPRPKLGELLLAQGKLSLPDLERALQVQTSIGGRLGKLLVQLGLVSEADVYAALSAQTGIPLVRTESFPTARPDWGPLNAAFLLAHHALPLGDVCTNDDTTPVFVTSDPLDPLLIQGLRIALGRSPELRWGLESEIAQRHREWLEADNPPEEAASGAASGASEFIEHLRDLASEAPIIRRVNEIIDKAVSLRASDIHIESYEDKSLVRARVDGDLIVYDEIDAKDVAAVVSRIKILSQLDIAERRLPQDGRTKLRLRGKEIDVRVSTVPTMHGESVVMRLLERNVDMLSLDRLSFRPNVLAALRRMLATPHGILLVTGPTGSGKSTTLYAAMRELPGESLKILTVEDPVEYRLHWLNQVQVQPQIGLTFAHVLRSFLRQDPDVIMIGEMRDGETAGIAVQAALTGHLVLSTLHTNSAAGAVVRLMNMGVEPYLISATLVGVLAQRLVRRLCDACKAPLSPPAAAQAASLLGGSLPADTPIYTAVGCPACRGTGYHGRLAIHELIDIDEAGKQAILGKRADLQGQDFHHVGGTLLQDGAAKVQAGLTTVEEVLRATRQDD
ncbi:MAG: ATPase, T2SS/T4P/T4SS family [Tepidimonas sp.]|nr:ATPase, T2SS/T4P/T4SS family [Tepidimonas sp.]